MRKLMKYLVLLLTITPVVLAATVAMLLLQVPQLPDRPKSPVVGVPEMAGRGQQPAYTGTHPRFNTRPDEFFPFPIALGEVGPITPLFAGGNRYPFLCGRDKNSQEQPLVDNQKGIGVPIFKRDSAGVLSNEVMGYSKDCLHPTQASYYYNREGTEKFYPLSEANDDIAKINFEGRDIDFIVRLERGTINRYFYGFAALKSEGDLANPSAENWNRRLVYQFRGGVGIGKRQGNFKADDLLKRRYDVLKKGYAVAYSTANQTSNHYNMWLAEDTAMRVKRQFISLYGEPLYTVGIGGSGGAIQQYLLAQNNPDLIDAAIPLYSYPDMVTQTTYVMDCEPLEYFFDVTDRENRRWRQWKKRSLVEGVNSKRGISNEFTSLNTLASLLKGEMPHHTTGASECVMGWRGLTPLVHNPNFVHYAKSFNDDIVKREQWSHWDDLKQFYGVDEFGYANSTWDNVGIQYGLNSLRDGQLNIDEFLKLNANVGGWKPFHEMTQEKLWMMSGTYFPVEFSQWSHHNMHLSIDGGQTPAKRTEGSLAAMEGAYRSGHVFVGFAGIPIIDLRHYLEDELDMHHSVASFSVRKRLLAGQGHADNQLIWMSSKPHTPINEAFETIDNWMLNIIDRPDLTVVENKPRVATDTCFDDEGEVIGSGIRVWDGDWNNREAGVCSKAYPHYKTSREVAGGGIAGDVFKCQLQSVSQAIMSGIYGEVDIAKHERRLQEIFPKGVCDFTQSDMGLPKGNWFSAYTAVAELSDSIDDIDNEEPVEIEKKIDQPLVVSGLAPLLPEQSMRP